MSDKYLLYPAEGDIDEDEGLTEIQMMKMLAKRLGYTVKRQNQLHFVAETAFEVTPSIEISPLRREPKVVVTTAQLEVAMTVEKTREGLLEGAAWLRSAADHLTQLAVEKAW